MIAAWLLLAVIQEEKGPVEGGVQARFRFEFKDPVDYRIPGRLGRPAAESRFAGDEWVIGRVRPWIRFNIDADIELYVQGQAAYVGDEAFAAIDGREDVDFHQLYFDFRKIAGGPVSLRVGRQELQFGDQRIVSPLDWSPLGRTWDGIKFTVEEGPVRADLWATAVREGADARKGRAFYGANVSCKAIEDHEVDVYAILREYGHDFFVSETGGTGDLEEWTVGARMKGKSAPWDYSAEIAGQTGSQAGDDVAAWALALTGGRTFEEACNLRVGIEYTYATGDDSPTDGDRNRFTPPATFGHSYQGYMDIFAWINGHALSLKTSIKPADDWSVGMDLHNFWLDEERDAWFNSGGAAIRRDATGSSGSYVGFEVDLHARWKLDTTVDLWFGVSHFWPGGYVDRTGFDAEMTWGFVQVTVTF